MDAVWHRRDDPVLRRPRAHVEAVAAEAVASA
jgi:hypothetical protein